VYGGLGVEDVGGRVDGQAALAVWV
jgi:hypothetical protein